jgi:hypothetical protein
MHESIRTAQVAPVAQRTMHAVAPEHETVQSPAHVTSQLSALAHAMFAPAATDSVQSTAPVQSTRLPAPTDPLHVPPSEQFTFDPAPTPRTQSPRSQLTSQACGQTTSQLDTAGQLVVEVAPSGVLPHSRV